MVINLKFLIPLFCIVGYISKLADALSANPEFTKPTVQEYQDAIKQAIINAKQRGWNHSQKGANVEQDNEEEMY